MGGGGIKAWAMAQREERESPETSEAGGSRDTVKDQVRKCLIYQIQ